MAIARFRTTGKLLNGTAARTTSAVTRRFVQGVAKYTRDLAREMAPVGTGRYRRSIIYRTTVRRGQVEAAVFSTLPYEAAATIELGRRTGAPPPPPGSLRAWLAAKGIDSRLEYVIARSIGREGYPGHFVFTRAYKRARGLIRQAQTLEVQLARQLR